MEDLGGNVMKAISLVDPLWKSVILGVLSVLIVVVMSAVHPFYGLEFGLTVVKVFTFGFILPFLTSFIVTKYFLDKLDALSSVPAFFWYISVMVIGYFVVYFVTSIATYFLILIAAYFLSIFDLDLVSILNINLIYGRTDYVDSSTPFDGNEVVRITILIEGIMFFICTLLIKLARGNKGSANLI